MLGTRDGPTTCGKPETSEIDFWKLRTHMVYDRPEDRTRLCDMEVRYITTILRSNYLYVAWALPTLREDLHRDRILMKGNVSRTEATRHEWRFDAQGPGGSETCRHEDHQGRGTYAFWETFPSCPRHVTQLFSVETTQLPRSPRVQGQKDCSPEVGLHGVLALEKSSRVIR